MKKTIFDTTTEDLDGSNTRPLDQDTNHEANSAVEDAQDCIQAAADLSWLDEDLLDLRTVVHEYFDLTTEFDISLYLDVLADEATKGIATLTTVPNRPPPYSAVRTPRLWLPRTLYGMIGVIYDGGIYSNSHYIA